MFSDVEIRLRNKVCRADLGCRIDLSKLRSHSRDRYTLRENFPGLVYKSGKASGAALVFSNGSLIITGEDNEHTIRRIAAEVAEDLVSLGYRPRGDLKIRVVNSVAQFRIRRPVDIAAFAQRVPNARLDSTRFPAVTWRDPDTRCTLRLFRNGAGVVLGSGDPRKIRAAVLNLYRTIARLKLYKDVSSRGTHNGGGRPSSLGEPEDGAAAKQTVGRAVLTRLLKDVFGHSVSKSVMRSLEISKGDSLEYPLSDVAEVLSALIGKSPTKAFVRRLKEESMG